MWKDMVAKTAASAVMLIPLIALMSAILGLVVMFLWNVAIAPVAGWPAMGYARAFGSCFVVGLLLWGAGYIRVVYR